MRIQSKFKVLPEQKVFRLPEQKVFRQNRIITVKNGLSVPTCSDFVPAIIGSNRIDKAKIYHFLPEHF